MTSTFKCKRCGWCCKNIVINICYSDVTRWFNSGRNDILREISFINNYPRKGTGGFYIAKTTFKPKQACPFLKKEKKGLYMCMIHETKPLACRDAPTSLEKFEKCPVFISAPEHIRNKLKKKQHDDFFQAHLNWRSLLMLLTEARKDGD